MLTVETNMMEKKVVWKVYEFDETIYFTVMVP